MRNLTSPLLLAGSLVVGTQTADACCGWAELRSKVLFGNQRNLIVWDSANQTQHFVRHAQFSTDSPEFGFIMPTPTLPELVPADARAFNAVEDFVRSFMPPASTLEANSAAPAAADLEILRKQDVGEYRTVSLRGSDARGITAYLKKNGYSLGADSKKWLSFYTKKKWILTAFKLKSGQFYRGKAEVEIAPIRASFKTDKPFNPYYVPKSNHATGSASLTIYFLAKEHADLALNEMIFAGDKTSHLDAPSSVLNSIRQGLILPNSVFIGDKLTVIQNAQFARTESDDLYFRRARKRVNHLTLLNDAKSESLVARLVPQFKHLLSSL